jgi:hypothetical protein
MIRSRRLHRLRPRRPRCNRFPRNSRNNTRDATSSAVPMRFIGTNCSRYRRTPSADSALKETRFEPSGPPILTKLSRLPFSARTVFPFRRRDRLGCRRNRRFESYPLRRGVRCEPAGHPLKGSRGQNCNGLVKFRLRQRAPSGRYSPLVS